MGKEKSKMEEPEVFPGVRPGDEVEVVNILLANAINTWKIGGREKAELLVKVHELWGKIETNGVEGNAK